MVIADKYLQWKIGILMVGDKFFAFGEFFIVWLDLFGVKHGIWSPHGSRCTVGRF